MYNSAKLLILLKQKSRHTHTWIIREDAKCVCSRVLSSSAHPESYHSCKIGMTEMFVFGKSNMFFSVRCRWLMFCVLGSCCSLDCLVCLALAIFNIYKFISQLFCAVGDSGCFLFLCCTTRIHFCSPKKKMESSYSHIRLTASSIRPGTGHTKCLKMSKHIRINVIWFSAIQKLENTAHTNIYNIYPRNMIINAKSVVIHNDIENYVFFLALVVVFCYFGCFLSFVVEKWESLCRKVTLELGKWN